MYVVKQAVQVTFTIVPCEDSIKAAFEWHQGPVDIFEYTKDSLRKTSFVTC